MLYIFHVDTGRMLTFDMNLAVESVQTLKETIERQHSFPVANQVLLISGGKILQASSRVCSYYSGMDTNPIYMFITNFSDTKYALQPWPSIEHQDTDFGKLVEQSISLPATYKTVVSRAKLAQHFYESASDEIKICNKLVYEQHLQQQGWATVIANLEDLTNEFRQRFDDFCRCFDEFLEKKDYYLKLLNNFDSDLNKLANVPILSGLIASAQQEFHGFDEYLYENESFSGPSAKQNDVKNERINDDNINTDMSYSCEQKSKSLTLLQWITAKETHQSFGDLSVNCLKQLQSFESDKISNLRLQIQKTIENSEKEDVREIKGLKDRLQGLDKLMVDVKNKVQVQSELAKAFQQNQNRANNLCDTSILPDLCETHSNQLHVMLKNHMFLRDIRRRISKAKEELGSNVMQRLKFIGHIENKMSELDNQMLFLHRCLRRLQRHLVIIEQIHLAPFVYVTAVNEVVRRRTFSIIFFEWATKLAIQLRLIYEDEVTRRQQFETLFDGHFLNCLFTGLDEMPASYGIQAPSAFDTNLPNLAKEDLVILSTLLPEVSTKINLSDISTVIDFFITTFGNSTNPIHKSSLQKIDNAARLTDLRSQLKDEFESETDTDEFEKVGQCSLDRGQLSIVKQNTNVKSQCSHQEMEDLQAIKISRKNIATSTLEQQSIEQHSIETLTEENLFSAKVEADRLRTILQSAFLLFNTSLAQLRSECNQMKNMHKTNQPLVTTIIEQIFTGWDTLKNNIQENHRETINQLTVNHELEFNDIKKTMNIKTSEINNYKEQITNLMKTIEKLTSDHENKIQEIRKEDQVKQEQIFGLELQLTLFQQNKERELKELATNLTRDHKTEIEALRCRFKLMTNMERTPSDTSLEKIERVDVLDLIAHDTILMQTTKEDYPNDREIPCKDVLERDWAKWERCMASPPKVSVNSDDLYTEILRQKENQLHVLMKENARHKDTIQKLIETDPSEVVGLKNQLDKISQEKLKLEDELNTERMKRLQMENSFMVDKNVIAMSTKHSSHTVVVGNSSCGGSSRSKTHLWKNRIILDGCVEGDIVVIVWDPDHNQYIIVQDSSIFYFLHELSHKCLNLTYPIVTDDRVPNKLHCIARVTNKEYCHAKKDDNRYKVSKGTKFYRIKAVPLVTPDKKHFDFAVKLNNKHERCEDRGSKSHHLLIDSFSQTDSLISITIAEDKIPSDIDVQEEKDFKEIGDVIEAVEYSEPTIVTPPLPDQCADTGNKLYPIATPVTILQTSSPSSSIIKPINSAEYQSTEYYSVNMPFS